MNAIQAFVPAKVVKTIAAFLDFCYIARRNIITEDSLKQLNVALHEFHESRQVFSGTARPGGPSAFSLPRQHAMVHYLDHIKNFGSPNGLCSSITESKHITAVKRPWRRTNKHAALPQMLKVNERLDKIAAARADFAARGMLYDSCLVQAIKATCSDDSENPMDEDTSNETDSDISDDEIRITGSNYTGAQDFRDTHTYDLNDINNINASTLDNADDEDNNYPHTPRQPSPTPDEEDCGPVESGPLMNAVRLVGRRGQKHPPLTNDIKLKHCS